MNVFNKIILLLLMCIIITGFIVDNDRLEVSSLDYVDSIIPIESFEEFDNSIESVKEDMVKERPEVILHSLEVSRPKGKWVWAKVTAYTSGAESCGKYADGKTSIGVDVHSGLAKDLYGIAADPNILPYGTKIYIPEYYMKINSNLVSKTSTYYENVDDTGYGMRSFTPFNKKIQGANRKIEFHIDVRFNQLRTAKEWGVKFIPVFVLD